MRSRLERLGAPAFHTYLEDVGLRAIAIGAHTRTEMLRLQRLRGLLLTTLRLLRIESEAALNPSRLEKKVKEGPCPLSFEREIFSNTKQL